MTFLDLFSGIGGFRYGLEKSGHQCVGHVEIDSYANKSYMAMYDLEYCKFKENIQVNSCMVCKKNRSENCDKTSCCGEWYAKDIERIRASEIPRAEIWTFGFPCQDISIAGNMEGIQGRRSGLFFTVISLLKGTTDKNKPKWLIIENVKHLVSSQKGGDFTDILFALWETGYDIRWYVVNSKNFGVPQHRERVYLIANFRKQYTREILSVSRTNSTSIKQLIGGKQGKRVYSIEGISTTLTANGGGFARGTGLYTVPVNQKNTITQKNKELINCKKNNSEIFSCQGHARCVMSVFTPNRNKKHQNGRRIKKSNEPSFTLTTTDRHGILLCCCNNHFYCSKNTDLKKNHICCRIRKLTPKECWRLQGFDDILFHKAKEAGISDTQLYKQAGNAVTVNIVYEIGKRLAELEGKR